MVFVVEYHTHALRLVSQRRRLFGKADQTLVEDQPVVQEWTDFALDLAVVEAMPLWQR